METTFHACVLVAEILLAAIALRIFHLTATHARVISTYVMRDVVVDSPLTE